MPYIHRSIRFPPPPPADKILRSHVDESGFFLLPGNYDLANVIRSIVVTAFPGRLLETVFLNKCAIRSAIVGAVLDGVIVRRADFLGEKASRKLREQSAIARDSH